MNHYREREKFIELQSILEKNESLVENTKLLLRE